METPKHTPLPWYKTASSPDGYIYGADNKCIVEFGPTTAGHMDEERWANAEFVVRACNAHDALLAAVNTLISVGITIDARLDVANKESMVKDNSGNRVYLAATCHKPLKTALWQARAAIALAEKE